MGTDITKEKQSKALTQHEKPSKQSRIVAMLAILGIRRQAKLSSQDYQVLAADLEEFDLPYIALALERIGKTPRPEGEPSFPAVGTLILAIRDAHPRRDVLAEIRARNAKAMAEVEAESKLGN